MARIDDIIELRRRQPQYDPDLWDFHTRVFGRVLENLSDAELQLRLSQLDRNIQHLEEGPGDRDKLPPERGWYSPWYWFRLRYWTLREMEERSLTPEPSIDVPAMPSLRPEFVGLHGGGDKLLVRISREQWMMDALTMGRLRFAPATDYREIEGDLARSDDEMRKGYRRPGAQITITGPDGARIEAIGDVEFDTRRAVADGEIEVPYWLTSYSTDLDPRLFADFASSEGDDVALVVFDPLALLRRAIPFLNSAAPLSEKRLNQVDYYDAYHPPSDQIDPLTMKDIRFAYQREFRMILDPGDREVLGGGGVLWVDIGSIEDIAGVYGKDGRRITGSGPETFLA